MGRKNEGKERREKGEGRKEEKEGAYPTNKKWFPRLYRRV